MSFSMLHLTQFILHKTGIKTVFYTWNCELSRYTTINFLSEFIKLFLDLNNLVGFDAELIFDQSDAYDLQKHADGYIADFLFDSRK